MKVLPYKDSISIPHVTLIIASAEPRICVSTCLPAVWCLKEIEKHKTNFRNTWGVIGLNLSPHTSRPKIGSLAFLTLVLYWDLGSDCLCWVEPVKPVDNEPQRGNIPQLEGWSVSGQKIKTHRQTHADCSTNTYMYILYILHTECIGNPFSLYKDRDSYSHVWRGLPEGWITEPCNLSGSQNPQGTSTCTAVTRWLLSGGRTGPSLPFNIGEIQHKHSDMFKTHNLCSDAKRIILMQFCWITPLRQNSALKLNYGPLWGYCAF